MNIREFTKITADKLNESLAKQFGERINIESFTTEQLIDARNKLRTKLFNIETTESFDAVQREDFKRSKLFIDVLNAAIEERNENISYAIDEAIETVNEGPADEAELVMAAKDMVDRITGWMEDTSEMQTESMLELADAIRDEYGSETAENFSNLVKPSLEELYDLLESTRQALTQGVNMLTGEEEPEMSMGDDELGSDDDLDSESDMDSELDSDLNIDSDEEDDFGASDVAAGGEDSEGREKRESINRHSKKKYKSR